MKLMHFSKTGTLELDRDRPYTTFREEKPDGLWVSNEDDYGWSQWVTDNEFGLETLEYAHDVLLAKDSRVFVISSLHDFDYFNHAYSKPGLLTEITGDPKYNAPDWSLVQQHYQGIIFEHYFWERRMEVFWYYGWDCASGVIWDLSAIEMFRSVNDRPKPSVWSSDV
ncbi:hypothetical protein SEA_SEPHIROTH_9 [Gordonia Phage Sephiroth]|uniref:Uncharacterized protein n=1 Tax=Gordonia Phage Sephiroth TaxID=2767553 RepID=A0A7G9UZ98_9CAUD|nr:hypothetical protein L3Y23_gp009 [Gordonia Phage Sephiroth]QNN99353.1 hypothetical protein SEA_SEPHIROTH_9 [Gordonia Phage Sephiroth]